MAHVHFDLAEVERRFRSMRAQAEAQIEGSAAPYTREIEAAASTAFEGTLALLMLTPRLRNEGRDDAFIAHVYGSILTNVMLNAIMSSSDPGMTVEIIGRRIDRMLTMVSEGCVPQGVFLGKDEVIGTKGGRA